VPTKPNGETTVDGSGDGGQSKDFGETDAPAVGIGTKRQYRVPSRNRRARGVAA